MRRLFAAVLSVLLLVTGFCISVQASQDTESVIWYEDGSCLETTIVVQEIRAADIKTAKEVQTYKNSQGIIEWQITLTATFTYDGTTSKATDAQCSVTIYDDAWSVVTKYAVRTGAMAEGHVTLSRSVLGMEVERPSYVVTLECDAEGNIS